MLFRSRNKHYLASESDISVHNLDIKSDLNSTYHCNNEPECNHVCRGRQSDSSACNRVSEPDSHHRVNKHELNRADNSTSDTQCNHHYHIEQRDFNGKHNFISIWINLLELFESRPTCANPEIAQCLKNEYYIRKHASCELMIIALQ